MPFSFTRFLPGLSLRAKCNVAWQSSVLLSWRSRVSKLQSQKNTPPSPSQEGSFATQTFDNPDSEGMGKRCSQEGSFAIQIIDNPDFKGMSKSSPLERG